MKISKKIATIAAVSGLAGLGVMSSAGTAAAGWNGQQIEFYDAQHVVNSISIVGHNQNGTPLAVCLATPYATTMANGWWWVGSVTVNYFTRIDGQADTYCGSNPKGVSYINVPQSQQGDYTFVSDAGVQFIPST